MGNWSTLNKGVTTSTKDAIEIQVERLLAKYQETLKYHQKGQLELAKEKYQELVSNALVKREPQPKKKTGTNVDLVEESPLSTLRFLVFKNYASILKDEFMIDQTNTETAKEALEHYIQAVKIDPTEYAIWYHIGYLSQTLKKLRFARLAYETGFYVNSNERTLKLHVVQPNDAIKIIKSGHFTPMQWKCLEGLCRVLYDIGDYHLCKIYIDIVMDQIADWDLGLQLREKMMENDSHHLETSVDEDTVMDTSDVPEVVSIALEKPDWSALVQSLYKEYKRLVCNNAADSAQDEDKDEGNEDQNIEKLTMCRLTNIPFVNKSIHITVDIEEEEEPAAEPMEEEKQPAVIPFSPKPQLPSEPIVVTEAEPSVTTAEGTPVNDNNKAIVIDDDVDMPMADEQHVSPQKRKREDDEAENEEDAENNDQNNSDNGGDSENDEESEAEEKRLSLRASKRQREKIANEETSRLKMLEEEKEFADMVQEFYDKVKDIPKLHREAPWYKSANDQDASTTLFWEWFDLKISELDSAYCWDVDTASNPNNVSLKNDSNLFGDSKGKNLTLFSKSVITTTTTTAESNRSSSAAVKEFITELNSNNSGITDSLCKLILTIIKTDNVTENNNQETSAATTISSEFLDLMTDAITVLEMNFVDSILSNKTTSAGHKISTMLRICEYLIDRLIRSIMTTVEETGINPSTTSHGRRRVTTSLTKTSKIKMVECLIGQCKHWISLLERMLFSSALDIFFSKINQSDDKKSDKLSLDEYKAQLRYWILKGKLAQCNGDIEEAYSWYVKCKSLLESSASHYHQDVSIDVKSMYDGVIDLASIESKLELLQIGKLFVTAKQKLDSEDYEGVIEDLESVVKPKLNSGDVTESNEIIQMINMLAKAYVKTNRNLEAWNCYMRMFCYLMKQLIIYGGNHIGSKQPYLNKNEDVEFFRLLGLINNIMDDLVLLIQGDESESWLPYDINAELADKLAILLRMSIYYVFRHPDFVPLVNNFTTPDVPPHTPSKITKSNGFNDIIIKAWVLQSHLFQHVVHNNQDPVLEEVMVHWADLLKELHDELGEREVCGAAKSILLQHVMKTFAKADDTKFRREIYQCYHCLYGVHLAAESDMIEEHHCVHTDLDQKASEPLFALVVDSAIEKLDSGLLLKTDLKDVVETVSELFEELPLKNLQIKNNKRIIDNYLSSDLELHPSLDRMLRTAIIPTMNICPKKTNTSIVYFKIFWIRGKTLRLQIKNRAKINNEKTMQDLEKAIEEFTFHLTLNPDDAFGWCELGACYQLLAEEELNWSASNIGAHRDLIGEYQRKSCHAYLRSIYLGNSRTTKELAKNELFTNFGNLVYSIASAPMNMEAFKAQTVKRTLGKDGKLVQVQIQPPSSRSAYKLAMIMYNHALRYKIHDKLEWRCYYMTGKCLAKIGRPPREVLGWYLQAIRRTKSKHGRHDHVLEPIYIFCSYLVKYLYQGKLEAEDVQEYLSSEKALHKSQATEDDSEQDVVCLGSSNDNSNEEKASALLEELKSQTNHLPSETAQAYNSVFQRLSEIRIIDSKNWHHRPIYRISWMYYHIYHNTEKAKAELMKLFTLKVTIKNYINIWKPQFELPGKHYEYHNKYTLFLFELAKETNDTQTLKQLYRKLRRAQILILNDKVVFQKAYMSYLEIIKVNLRSIHQAKKYMKMIKESKIDKSQFEALCSTSSKAIADDKSIADPELYGMLQDLSELKRITQGFITGDDAENDGLDKVIRMCYAALIFGGEFNESKQKELENAVSTNEESIESRSRKELRAVLLVQAKLFMQTITSASK